MGLLNRLVNKNSGVHAPRSAARLVMDQRVDIRLARDNEMHAVFLEDLSASGACISTPLHLARNEELTLAIPIGPMQRLEFGCRVVSVRRRGDRLHVDYGVRFIQVRAADIELLRKYLAAQLDHRKTGTTAFGNDRPAQ